MRIGITTSPRTHRYLVATVQSIRSASRKPVPLVIAPQFADPGEDWDLLRALGCEVLEPLVPQSIEEFVASRPELSPFTTAPHGSEYVHRGLQANTDRVMRHLAEDDPWFVVCQDDLVCCRRAIDRIEQVIDHLRKRPAGRATPAVGAVSFYTPYRQCGLSRRALWRYRPGFYGELCLLWRREAAVAFLAQSNHGNAHDLEIARFFERNARWHLYGHSPCLVQHVGVVSARGAVAEGHQRTTMNFTAGHDAVRQGKVL